MAGQRFDIRYVAELARIALTDEEVERYGRQLGRIIDHVEQLGKLDVEGIEPTAHAAPVHDVLREDVSRPGFAVEEALANAPRRAGDQFLVPKVVE